jgi:hypothetical protein
LFNKNSVEIEIDLIKDFEMIQRRAKILMQTVCHISGAAYLYDKNLIHEKYNEQGEKSDEPKKVKNFWVYVYITLNSGYITFQRKCFVANEYITQKCK